MRTHGVWTALGYDWLYDSLSPTERSEARTRFRQWIAFHQKADTYQRAQPGANYHAGHVLAMTLIAVTAGDELTNGAATWTYVADTMWGGVMNAGSSEELAGGDWLEGWQYAPLSWLSYSLGARAMLAQGDEDNVYLEPSAMPLCAVILGPLAAELRGRQRRKAT